MSSSPIPLDPATPPGADSRRLFERYLCSRPFPRSLLRADTPESLDAWIVDLSMAGTTLIVEKVVAADTKLILELEACQDARPVKVWANVIYCRPTGSGEYRLGCQFEAPLNADDLKALLE